MRLTLKHPLNGSTDVQLDTSKTLGRGGDAVIHKATIGGKTYAAKIYHDVSKVNAKKLEAMIANPPSRLTSKTAGIDYPIYAWPIEILYSGNRAVGFLMPLVDLQSSFTLDFYYDPGLISQLQSADEYALSYRVEIAAHLSGLIADLHAHQHYFIDLKPQNIRVFKRTHAVTLIDCDGFSITDPGVRKVYPATMFSSDYIAPEALRNKSNASDLGEPQDLYALAVIIFQLFNGGIHPFQGILTSQAKGDFNSNDDKVEAGLYPHGLMASSKIKPRLQSVHTCFDDRTRELFDRAFVGPQGARPTAQEWFNHLSSLYTSKQLVRCDVYPNDIKHMRWKDKPCPGCVLDGGQQKVRQTLSKSTITNATSPTARPVSVRPVGSSSRKSSSASRPLVKKTYSYTSPSTSSASTSSSPAAKKSSSSSSWSWGGGIVIAVFFGLKALMNYGGSWSDGNCSYSVQYSKTIYNGKCSYRKLTNDLPANAHSKYQIELPINGSSQVNFWLYNNRSAYAQGGKDSTGRYIPGRYQINDNFYVVTTNEREVYWFPIKH